MSWPEPSPVPPGAIAQHQAWTGWSLPVTEAERTWTSARSSGSCSERGAFSLPVHDLRQQMAALQSQLRQVQLERTTLTSRLKTSQAEIASLQSVRQWYQQQLALAQEARVRLQGEMAHIQVRPTSPRQLPCKSHVKPLLFPKLKRLQRLESTDACFKTCYPLT